MPCMPGPFRSRVCRKRREPILWSGRHAGFSSWPWRSAASVPRQQRRATAAPIMRVPISPRATLVSRRAPMLPVSPGYIDAISRSGSVCRGFPGAVRPRSCRMSCWLFRAPVPGPGKQVLGQASESADRCMHPGQPGRDPWRQCVPGPGQPGGPAAWIRRSMSTPKVRSPSIGPMIPASQSSTGRHPAGGWRPASAVAW